MNRNEILQSLRDALKHNKISREDFVHIDHMNYDRDNLLDVYMQYQKANMSDVIVSNQENLKDDINKTIKNLNINEILCSRNMSISLDDLECKKIIYDFSVDDNRNKIFDIQASIFEASLGVANLGILGISTHILNPRLASLVVTNCIILLKRENIVANLFEAFKILKTSGINEDLPTNIVFLAGPSRTADIELKTVFGVHGPRDIKIIIY